MSTRKHILSAGLLAFIVPGAHAADGEVGANLGARGAAGAAVRADNAALNVNPGLAGLDERYDVHAAFRLGPDYGARWGASALDARTLSWLAVGLLYNGRRANPPLTDDDLPGWTLPGVEPENVKRNTDLTLVSAVNAFDRRLSIGLSGTLAFYSHDLHGKGTTGNMDAGLGLRLTDGLSAGFAGRNLLPVDGVGDLPLTLVGGLALAGKPGALAADVEWRDLDVDQPLTIAGGGELPVGDIPRLRLGYRYEGPIDTHRITGGVGFVGGSGSFDLGVGVPVSPSPTLAGVTWMIGIVLTPPKADDPPGW